MTVKERIIGLESFMAPTIIDFSFFWFICIASRRGIKEEFSGSIHQQQGTVVKSFKVSTEKRLEYTEGTLCSHPSLIPTVSLKCPLNFSIHP